MGTNFLDYPHKPSFAAFSDTMIYWWEASYASNVMKYTVGQESGRIEATILWEMYGHQYPRLHGMGFTGFFHAMEYWWQISFISPMIKYAFFFLWNSKINPAKPYYCDLYYDWTIVLFEWFFMIYSSRSLNEAKQKERF